MAKRSRRVSEEIIGTENDGKVTVKLIVEVFFQEGGLSYFDYKQHPRGFFFSVSKIRCEASSPGVEVRQLIGGGSKFMLMEAKRFSQKILDTIEIPQVKLDEIKAHVKATCA